MDLIRKGVGKLVRRVVDHATGSGLLQEENTPEGERYYAPGFPELIRQAAAESCVLLKNDGVLPLSREEEIAVFGRCQLDWFYVGYGSGGDVHPARRVNLMQGLQNAGMSVNGPLAAKYASWTAEKANRADPGWWGHWPYNYPEMPLDAATVREAARSAKTAVVVIGRAAGEDRENTLTQGSYYLTDLERDMLDRVTEAFSRTVVLLNVGSVPDMAWTENYSERLSAILLVWQGGMESGNAVADVLCGRVSPCGKLSDTIARYYVDYPSSANFGGLEYNDYAEGIFVGYRHFERSAPGAVLFPFGFGLSYTSFEVLPLDFSHREGAPAREQHWPALRQGRRAALVRAAAGGARKAPARARRLRQDAGALPRRERGSYAHLHRPGFCELRRGKTRLCPRGRGVPLHGGGARAGELPPL